MKAARSEASNQIQMSTKPTDTAYLISYQQYTRKKTALVIAANPFQAMKQAEESLPPEGLRNVMVAGKLRNRIHEAQDDDHGVVRL